MTGAERDVERTDLDVRVEAEDRAGVTPVRVEGADVIAHREVIRRSAASPIDRPLAVEAHRIAVEVLAEAHDRAARDEWDPLVHLGSVAAGIVRALRDLGAVPR